MNKLMDVNPFKHREEPAAETPEQMETPKESSMCKMGRWCRACYPKSGMGWIAFVLALVLAWTVLASFGLVPSLTFPAVDSVRWQAVFLTNGQVYFGHLKEANRDYAVLSDIYYLRVSQQLQPSSQQQETSINLVKLGGEIHGPEDVMYVPKSQIIFWENMVENSPVVQVINQLKNPAPQQ